MNNQLGAEYLELRQKTLEHYYREMNDMQRRAVFKIDGPLLILAGAGSGKTTVLINRIEYMVRFGNGYYSKQLPQNLQQATDTLKAYLAEDAEGKISQNALIEAASVEKIKPWNILAITFTNKAAGELKSRLEKALDSDGKDVHASTFHSLCVRILRRDIEVLGYGKGFTIYDTDDSVRVIKEAIKLNQLDEKMFQPKSVLGAIGRAKDKLLTPQQLKDSAGDDFRVASIAKVYEGYQRTLKNANAVDFDDIITLTVRLLKENPKILEYYQNKFKYIMVDEYQDTNHSQYMLISLLADRYKNLCVVGDDDQSIYKFRGATIENILSFEDQFEDTEIIRLEQNYRSTQNILDAANSLIKNNSTRKGKNLWTSSTEGELLRVVRLRDEIEESRIIADHILDNVKDGASFSDHAILYRMNAQSNSVEKGLVKNAIPYRIVGGLRFYERKEIKDMVAYLSVLANKNDNLRLLRIINEPKRGIGGSTITAAQEIADSLGVSLYEALDTSDQYEPLAKKSSLLMGFTKMMDDFIEIADSGALDTLLDRMLADSGYLSMLQSQGFEGAGRLENILELKSNIIKYMQEDPQPSLSGFLEEIALYTDLDSLNSSEDKVILMTIHASKGLEFPFVIIAGMDEGIFPGRSAMSFPAEIEEERRLAYVAITRAEKHLTITSAERRMIFGQTMFGRPSRFVAEIPDHLCALEDRTKIERPKNANPHKTSKQRNISTASSTTIGVGSAQQTTEKTAFLIAGDAVNHKVFGQGTVISARPIGGDTLVEIDFNAKGIKKVMANFAPLTKI